MIIVPSLNSYAFSILVIRHSDILNFPKFYKCLEISFSMIKRGKVVQGQATVYIIIALVLVAVILLVLVLVKYKGMGILTPKPKTPIPSEYIEQCARDSAQNAIDIMLPQGGYINPKDPPKPYRTYDNKDIAYLCYYNEFYNRCINQEPNYFYHLEEEIKSFMIPKMKDCIYNLTESYRKAGYEVRNEETSDLKIDVNIKPKKIELKIEKKLEISKGNDTRVFEKTQTFFNSPIYDMARTAIWIVNGEAQFCYFEVQGYSLLPLFYAITVDRIILGENPAAGDVEGTTGTKIYKIKERASGKTLYIATRSCITPPGR